MLVRESFYCYFNFFKHNIYMNRDQDFEIHYAEEWAALYVDGQLITVGDAYNTEEQALNLLGVKTIQDEAFMCGGNSRENVAKTLEEVEDFKNKREELKQKAETLRKQAALLEEEAKRLLAESEKLT